MINQKHFKPAFFLASIILLLVSCSQKNDRFVNRAYHNTTARYNGYFNAREAIKEGVKQVKESKKENFLSILPAYFMVTEDEATSLKPYMDKAIEKCSHVIEYHSMDIRGEEKCKWIDESYYTIGLSHYYNRNFEEAARAFNYVFISYPDEPSSAWAKLYEARTFLEAENTKDAGLALSKLEQKSSFPKRFPKELHKTRAQLEIIQGNYETAIPSVKSAIRETRKKKERARLYFLLAQLYKEIGDDNNALKAYASVSDNNGSYDLQFYSKINRATAVTGKNNAPIVRRELLKMLSDDKNKDYFDQIYFALGEIEIRLKEKEKAIAYFEKSTTTEIRNPAQQTRSYLRLAELYFDERNFFLSQINYDSAVARIPESYPHAAEIKDKEKKLGQLVDQLKIVQANDSLLHLARLPESELNRKLKKIANDMMDAQRAALANQTTAVAATNALGTSAWYFYNDQVRGQGEASFNQKWGPRPLEDFWRFEAKGISSGGSDPQDNSTNDPNFDIVEIDIEDLKKGIPFDPLIQATKEREVEEALFEAGKLFKQNFDDLQGSTESFENLLSRFPNTDKKLTLYYLLYRNYLEREEGEASFMSFDSKSSSFYYSDLITYEYPNSEFAKIISNPDYLKEKATATKGDQAEYIKYYQAFINGNSPLIVDDLVQHSQATATDLTPKYLFLLAKVYSDLQNFSLVIPTLEELVKGFPITEEGKRGQEILDILKNGAAPAPTTNELFKESFTEEHYLIVLLENQYLALDKAKNTLGDFNQQWFKNDGLSISSTFISNDLPMALVKKFKDADIALAYYTIYGKKIGDFNKKMEDNKESVFVISRSNFIELFKSKDINAYKEYFKIQYF